MKNIVIIFPTGERVRATLLPDQEKELVSDFAEKISSPLELVCNHSVSAGKIFDAYMRPTQEPVSLPKGANPVVYAELEKGDLLWDGEKLRVVYGEVMQPGAAGCVIGKAEVTDKFEKACMSVWYDIYREHEISVISVVGE